MENLNMITGEDVKKAMIESNTDYVEHHRCGICDQTVFYSRDGDRLFFNPGCGCFYTPPEERSFEDAANWINMQSCNDIKLKLKKKFGFDV